MNAASNDSNGLDQLAAVIRNDLGMGDEPAAVVELPSAEASAAAEVLVPAGRDGPALAFIPGHATDDQLAALRDAVWPQVHFMAVYRVGGDGGAVRVMREGTRKLDERLPGPSRTIVYTRTHQDALGQKNTVIKFDLRASAWNGNPGSPTYPHYRWMRRLIAVVAEPRAGERTLDAGCGTGWVGIEAARLGALVSAFDASPAMVELALQNAAEIGVPLDARPGFVEDVPFDESFELVLNSGVISFAPDPKVYLSRLDSLVAPGGRLCIGDINPVSRGFLRRRSGNPLLPARELNGLTRDGVETMLTELGYEVDRRWYYQLSFPVPELMALSEKRMGGFGCGLMLAGNRALSRIDQWVGSRMRHSFDSWILRARKAGG